MNPETLIANYTDRQLFSHGDIEAIRSNPALRSGLCNYLRSEPHHDFAIALLKAFIILRQNQELSIGMEDLMLGAYLVGLHQQVEDCLLVWEAKQVDFDTYSGVDVQLIVFAGVQATFDFLEAQHTELTDKMLDYLRECRQAGDFDDLDDYFNPGSLPWWV